MAESNRERAHQPQQGQLEGKQPAHTQPHQRLQPIYALVGLPEPFIHALEDDLVVGFVVGFEFPAQHLGRPEVLRRELEANNEANNKIIFQRMDERFGQTDKRIDRLESLVKLGMGWLFAFQLALLGLMGTLAI